MDCVSKIQALALAAAAVIYGGEPLYARDSLAAVGRYLPSTLFWEQVYGQPAAMPWQPCTGVGSVEASYAYNNQDTYHLLRDGEGGHAFGLAAEGTARRALSTLWGSASYGHLQREHVQWSSVADHFRMGPYQITDTIGGRVYGEQYRLSGGLAAPLGRWTLAAEIAYTAGNTYRRNDPRQKTITSDLLTKVGVSVPLGRQQAGLTLYGGSYQQDVNVNIMAFVDKGQVYAMRGFGLYDLLHSGYTSSFTWQYNGASYGAAAFLLPHSRKGWMLLGEAGRESMESLAEPGSSISRYPFMLVTLRANALAGYSLRSSTAATEVRLRWNVQKSTGNERLYKQMAPEGATLQGYHLLSESDKYTRALRQLTLSGLHERYGNRSSRWILLDVGVESYAERYAYPAYEVSYLHATVQATAGGELRWKKSLLAAEVALGYRRLVASDEKTPTDSYIFALSMQPDLEVMASSPLSGSAKASFEHDFIGGTRWFTSVRAYGLRYRSRHAAWVAMAVGAVF